LVSIARLPRNHLVANSQKVTGERLEMLKVTMGVTIFFTLIFIFELLRRKALREKYAFVWIVTALLLVVGALFPDLAIRLSTSLGFATIASFLMVFFGLIMLFITMQLSLELGKVEDQNQRLAEELALLKLKSVE
jgi:hypothetical protein